MYWSWKCCWYHYWLCLFNQCKGTESPSKHKEHGSHSAHLLWTHWWTMVLPFSIYHLYHLTPHQQKPFYSSHCCLVKSQYHILNHSIHWPCNEGMQNLHHQLKARGKVIVPCTNKFTCACISSKYPSLIHPSTDGFFMGYFNSSKVVI